MACRQQRLLWCIQVRVRVISWSLIIYRSSVTLDYVCLLWSNLCAGCKCHLRSDCRNRLLRCSDPLVTTFIRPWWCHGLFWVRFSDTETLSHCHFGDTSHLHIHIQPLINMTLLNRKWPHPRRQEAPSWPSFHGCWFWPSSACEGRGWIGSPRSWPLVPALYTPRRERAVPGTGSWTSHPESPLVPSLWWAAGAEAARPKAAAWPRPSGAYGRPGCCSSAWPCALPPSVSGPGTCRSTAAAWWDRGWRRSTRRSTGRSRCSPVYTLWGRGQACCWCQIWWGTPPPEPGSRWPTAARPVAGPRASCCSWVVLTRRWTCKGEDKNGFKF